MIKGFRSDETRALFEGERVARFANIEKVAIRKLQMLHAAQRIDSLRIPPNNRLEALRGDRTAGPADRPARPRGRRGCGSPP